MIKKIHVSGHKSNVIIIIGKRKRDVDFAG
jgi:hypothetical protein